MNGNPGKRKCRSSQAGGVWCYLEEPTYVGNEEETLLDRMSTRYGFSSLRSVRKTSMLLYACIGLMQEFGARNVLQVVED